MEGKVGEMTDLTENNSGKFKKHNYTQNMKAIRHLSVAALIIMSACTQKPGIIEVTTPPRPEGQEHMVGFAAEPIDTVRIGFIGLGMRGPGAVYRMSNIEGTRIVALCDVEEENVRNCQELLAKNGRPEAEGYYGSEEVWKHVCERDDIDLIYIATDWKTHAAMAKYAMEHGKHVAIEVPAAMNMNEIWDLVNTSERTRRHCMQLENCVYDFFELTSLNMAQHGLFGEIIHAEGGYIHNLAEFWDEYWHDWRLEYNREHRGDVYPTHGIGPVCQALDIHRGDRMDYLVSMDTRSFNGLQYYRENRNPETEEFMNGDQTSTLIRTVRGKTILIQHNVVTPRPYNRLYQLVGTKGFASKYPVPGYMIDPEKAAGPDSADGEKKAVDFEDLSAHNVVPENVRKALEQQYRHPIQVELEEKAKSVGGHGGMDYIMDYRLIYCLRNGLPLDMDVYDLAEWCCLTELTGLSIENNSAPVRIPDFTRGEWNRTKGYRHAFAD